MSADIAICIAPFGNLFGVYMGFASDDYAMPDTAVKCFDDHKSALAYAVEWLELEAVVEYGIVDLTTREVEEE